MSGFHPLIGLRWPTLPIWAVPWGCSMSSWDEEMFTMMGGFAAFAVLCIAALLWLV